jgi:uncharacterized protein (TIGR02186 family)
MRLVALLLMLLAPGLRAEEIVLGLSSDEVAITATFDGSDILVFGAVKRDGPAPSATPLQVIISVSGPLTPVVVRRKERRWGIWMNIDAVQVDAAPSFYAVASTATLAQALSETEDLRHRISIPSAIRSVGNEVADAGDFTQALIRIRTDEGLYKVMDRAVLFTEETLFRAQFALPANLIEGNYDTRIFLTRDGMVVDSYETRIDVRKVGLERWLFNLAQEHRLGYAALSLALAILAGWAASAAFQSFRR